MQPLVMFGASPSVFARIVEGLNNLQRVETALGEVASAGHVAFQNGQQLLTDVQRLTSAMGHSAPGVQVGPAPQAPAPSPVTLYGWAWDQALSCYRPARWTSQGHGWFVQWAANWDPRYGWLFTG